MVRFLVSLLLGLAVTFALFSFMAFLVSSGDRNDEKPVDNIIVEVNTTPPKSSAEQRRRVPPPPPPPPKAPPKQQAPEPEPAQAGGIEFNMPSVSMSAPSAGLSGPGSGIGSDGDATPIVRIEPKYPMAAARDGIEGYVVMTFTIDALGGVTDVKVIEAKPKRLFNKAATRALRKWKYKPKVEDGKALIQTGLSVRLDFNIEGNNDE